MWSGTHTSGEVPVPKDGGYRPHRDATLIFLLFAALIALCLAFGWWGQVFLLIDTVIGWLR